MALCGEPMTDDENPPALLNPSVVVEVLSPSAELTDFTEKLMEYGGLTSVTDYVLAAQDRIAVLHYVRQQARQWQMT